MDKADPSLLSYWDSPAEARRQNIDYYDKLVSRPSGCDHKYIHRPFLSLFS